MTTEQPVTDRGQRLLRESRLHRYECDLNIQISEGDPDFYTAEGYSECSCGLREAIIEIENEAFGLVP